MVAASRALSRGDALTDPCVFEGDTARQRDRRGWLSGVLAAGVGADHEARLHRVEQPQPAGTPRHAARETRRARGEASDGK